MFRLRLEITGAQGPARLVELRLAEKATVKVGRLGCDVLLEDRAVSRSHLGFGVQKGLLVAGDLGSTGGTLHNGKALKRATVHKGDLFQVGSHSVLVLGFRKIEERAPKRRLGLPKPRFNRWAIASSFAAVLMLAFIVGTSRSDESGLYGPSHASVVDIDGALSGVRRWVRARQYAPPDPTRPRTVDYNNLFQD